LTIQQIPQLLRGAVGLHQRGQLAEAEKLYAQVLALDAKQFDALHLLGLLKHQRGDSDQAIRLMAAALDVNPKSPQALLNYAGVLCATNRHAEALACYDRVLTLAPNEADAHYNRGNALMGLDRHAEALAAYDRALALNPNNPLAHYNRGNALAALGRAEEALAAFHRAAALAPQFVDAQVNIGRALSSLHRDAEALSWYDRALTFKPNDPVALTGRGVALAAAERNEEALASFDRVLALKPDEAGEINHQAALNGRGLVLLDLGRHEEALACFDRLIELAPDDPSKLINRGIALVALDRQEEALSCYDRVLQSYRNATALSKGGTRDERLLGYFDQARAPEAETYNNMGNALTELGRLQEARQAYLKAIEVDPKVTKTFSNLGDLTKFTSGDPQISAMEALAKSDALTSIERMQLDFALGKAYLDLGDHQRSFEHLLSGNAGKRAMISYDEKSTLAFFERIEAIFTPELLAAKSGGGDPSKRPIFVIGMPRSGTTLIEQLLASHPTVHGAGELRFLSNSLAIVRRPDGKTIRYPKFVSAADKAVFKEVAARYLASLHGLAPDAGRITDKMPSNYYFAGLIHLALPNAKIIHIARDPVDTCVSCFSTLFATGQSYAYDLAELGRYYKRYEHLMEHWRRVLPAGRVLDVRYEDVVADFEGEARRIISYCDLPWDDRCLSFHETNRPVKTASATQVRRPIYKSAIGRWRVYEKFLNPLLRELDVALAKT
jgi:tetratricopeptide (TPR) repeat protein